MKKQENKKPQCLYCKDQGFFSDCLSGGESYCTCPIGKQFKKTEEELNHYLDNYS